MARADQAMLGVTSYRFLLPSGVSKTFLRVSVSTSESLSLASSGPGPAVEMALVTPYCLFFGPSMVAARVKPGGGWPLGGACGEQRKSQAHLARRDGACRVGGDCREQRLRQYKERIQRFHMATRPWAVQTAVGGRAAGGKHGSRQDARATHGRYGQRFTRHPTPPALSPALPPATHNMASRLPTSPRNLSRKSVLALLPPTSMLGAIEAVRSVHDKHFKRWPPHIKLIYPFLESPSELLEQGGRETAHLKQHIRTRIERAIRGTAPFEMSLTGDLPGSFRHKSTRRDCTVCLGPTTQSVHNLQAALAAEFIEFVTPPHYSPHLSIGQARGSEEMCTIRTAMEANVRKYRTYPTGGRPRGLDWLVDRVYVLERTSQPAGDEHKTRWWNVTGTVPLGRDQLHCDQAQLPAKNSFNRSSSHLTSSVD